MQLDLGQVEESAIKLYGLLYMKKVMYRVGICTKEDDSGRVHCLDSQPRTCCFGSFLAIYPMTIWSVDDMDMRGRQRRVSWQRRATWKYEKRMRAGTVQYETYA